MQADNTSPAHEYLTPSGARQTQRIIGAWCRQHRGMLRTLGLVATEIDHDDLVAELYCRLLERQRMPSRWDPSRGSWSHYVWVFCRSKTINMASRPRHTVPIADDWDPADPHSDPNGWEILTDASTLLGSSALYKRIDMDLCMTRRQTAEESAYLAQ
jgi:hypothetical protein